MNSITGFDIKKVEKKYGSTYIGDFPIRLKDGGWGNPGAVFYQPNPDITKGHTNYFGLVNTEKDSYIYDAAYLLAVEFHGVKDGDNYLWSRHRHDYREVPGGFIDGGFDYLRLSGTPLPKVVALKIDKDKVVEA